MDVIPGRMFADMFEDYDAFFVYGPGAMCWSKDEESRRTLWFLAPSMRGRRFDTARIYTETDGKDWCSPGSVQGWDGNIEKPTFNPSIWLHDRKGWHGWITAGNLVTA